MVNRTAPIAKIEAENRQNALAEIARIRGIEGGEAAALTAWMAAQDLNPASPSCGAAVKRLAALVAKSAAIKAATTTPIPAAVDEVPVPTGK